MIAAAAAERSQCTPARTHTHDSLNTDPMSSEAFATDSDTDQSDYDKTRTEPYTGLSGFRIISETGLPRRALINTPRAACIGLTVPISVFNRMVNCILPL